MFVLNVDLWNEDGTREVNLVRSSTSSPSISSTTPYAYATISVGDSSHSAYGQNIVPPTRDPAYNMSYTPDYQSQPSYTTQGNLLQKTTHYDIINTNQSKKSDKLCGIPTQRLIWSTTAVLSAASTFPLRYRRPLGNTDEHAIF